jgi:hypothetical protein
VFIEGGALRATVGFGIALLSLLIVRETSPCAKTAVIRRIAAC